MSPYYLLIVESFQGFLIGNALIEPSMIKNVNRQFFYFGLINKEELNIIEPLMKSFREDIDAHNSVAAKDVSKLNYTFDLMPELGGVMTNFYLLALSYQWGFRKG